MNTPGMEVVVSDIVIIGGGVVGLSLAYELRDRQASVTLLARSDLAGESSWAGAGILAPGSLDGDADPENLLRAHTQKRIAQWSRALEEETGIDNGFRRCGSLVVALGEGETPVRAVSDEGRWRATGVPVDSGSPRDLERWEPNLKLNAAAAFRLPTETQLRNPRHCRALTIACGHHHRLELDRPVTGFKVQGSRVVAAQTAGGEVAGDRFVVAAGAWSRKLLQTVGVDLEVKPIRGQIVLLKAPKQRLRSIVWCGSRYLVPRDDGYILVGATLEDVGFVPHATAEGVRGLLDFALRLAPDLGDFEVERTWAGLRPGSKDGLPYLGAVPGFDNLFVATGHYWAGVELSAGTALVMAELLCGEEPSVPLEHFRPDR